MIIFLNLKNNSKNELIYITRNTMALKGLKSDDIYVFYCLFIDQNQKIVLSHDSLFHQFFKCNFLSPKCLITPIFYTTSVLFVNAADI